MLDANRIHFIKNKTFDYSLPYLSRLDLRRNLCIHDNFCVMDMRRMRNEIGRNCVDNSNREILEKAVADLRQILEIKSEKIEALEK